MPDGSLNEYAVAAPALGVPCRENSTRSTEWMSVMVPTVEREWPPTGRWSTTMAGVRSSRASACGRSYLGSRLRTNQVNVSFSWRRDSTAIVSNTTDDFPDPETPVNTVSRPFGMRSETFWRLFSLAPVMLMNSLMPGTLGRIPDSLRRDFPQLPLLEQQPARDAQ
ncbi:hypothetical protein STENM36S_04152 [Streptomyces tendae]